MSKATQIRQIINQETLSSNLFVSDPDDTAADVKDEAIEQNIENQKNKSLRYVLYWNEAYGNKGCKWTMMMIQ